jgi:hypothetical protein
MKRIAGLKASPQHASMPYHGRFFLFAGAFYLLPATMRNVTIS